MLWSVEEAVERQTLQIGASACGATAVVDVLQALGITVAPETADLCVRTRLRKNEAPLSDYLFSRSEAGRLLYNAATSSPVRGTSYLPYDILESRRVGVCVNLIGISS